MINSAFFSLVSPGGKYEVGEGLERQGGLISDSFGLRGGGRQDTDRICTLAVSKSQKGFKSRLA